MDHTPQKWDVNISKDFKENVPHQGNYTKTIYLKNNAIEKSSSSVKDVVRRFYRPDKRGDSSTVRESLQYNIIENPEVRSNRSNSRHLRHSLTGIEEPSGLPRLNNIENPTNFFDLQARIYKKRSPKKEFIDDDTTKPKVYKPKLEIIPQENDEELRKLDADVVDKNKHLPFIVSNKLLNKIFDSPVNDENSKSVTEVDKDTKKTDLENKVDILKRSEFIKTMKSKLLALQTSVYEFSEMCLQGLISTDLCKDPAQCENVLKSMKNEFAVLQTIFDDFSNSCHKNKEPIVKNDGSRITANMSLPKIKELKKTSKIPVLSRQKTPKLTAPKTVKHEKIGNKAENGVDLDLPDSRMSNQGKFLRKTPGAITQNNLPLVHASKLEPKKPSTSNTKTSKKFPDTNVVAKKLLREVYIPISKKDTECYKRYKNLKLQKSIPIDRIFQFIRDCCFDVFKFQEKNDQKSSSNNSNIRKSGGMEKCFSQYTVNNSFLMKNVKKKKKNILKMKRKHLPKIQLPYLLETE